MEQLKVSTDWDIIEKNLCNILCCHLESEFKQSDLDPNVCKLFQLAQISIEYLLQIRQQILTELQKWEEKMQTSQLVIKHKLNSFFYFYCFFIYCLHGRFLVKRLKPKSKLKRNLKSLKRKVKNQLIRNIITEYVNFCFSCSKVMSFVCF